MLEGMRRALTGIRYVEASMVLDSSPQETVNLAFSVNDAAGRQMEPPTP